MFKTILKSTGILGCLLTLGLTDTTIAGEIIPLNSTWKIQPAVNSSNFPKDDQWKSKLTPTKGVNSFWYQQSMLIPQEWEGKRIFLDFSRIEGDTIVFVNKKKVGELLRPGGEIEITAQAKAGADNLLWVFVTRDYTDISRGFEQDRIRYVCRNHARGKVPVENWGVGISGPVNLLSRSEPVGISSVWAEPSWRKKEITFNLDIDATAPTTDLSAQIEIFDSAGNKALAINGPSFSVSGENSSIKVASKWDNPHLWELDDGYLYTAKVSLMQGKKLLDSFPPFSFGFREIWTNGRKLMLNGHEMHWRLTMLHPYSFGDASPKGLALARLLGFNAGYIQNHPELWWRGCGWAPETPLFSQPLLDAADRAGFAVMLPAPSVAFLSTALNEDAAARKDFEREMNLHMRHYRNHPSVMSWTVSMNSVGFANEAIAPENMGCRFAEKRTSQGHAKAVETACKIANTLDPSRLTYSHADGNLTNIASTNFYLNFAPLQEREEWPKHWAESGNMPYMMVECGQPYIANFWKGKRFLPTEYFAMYFGDKAYEKETETGMDKLIESGLGNKGHGIDVDWNQYPVYWDFQKLFVRNTNRAFRMWGINGGWSYWSFNVGYGKPKGTNFESMELITSKPSWANPNFDVESQANQDLLVYIAGAKTHTGKTHLFFSGEKVEKTIAIAWDGPGKTKIDAEWSVKSPDRTIVSGKVQAVLNTGDLKQLPFSFTAPEVTARTDLSIELKSKQDGKEVQGDIFPLTVFPKSSGLKSDAKIAVYDPEGKSTLWLKTLGLNPVPLKKGGKINGFDILIMGRESIVQSEALPFNKDDIRRGLKVLVLEQLPAVWRGLGFRSNETMPRQVFPVGENCPVMKGLNNSDLTYWRGSPDLLPEGENQVSETKHASKWTNTHAIASSIPQIPRVAGFSPLLSAEFDLDYSPLLEWKFGKGLILFSGLDFTGRVGKDPAATILVQNIISYLDSYVPEQTRQIVCNGDENAISLLHRLGMDPVQKTELDNPAGTILVVGNEGSKIPREKIEKFVSEGGRVFFLPQSPGQLVPYGLKTVKKSVRRVPVEKDNSFRNIGPNLLRWRDSVEINAFAESGQPNGVTVLADGLAAIRHLGKGDMFFCQISPVLLEEKYKNDKAKAEAVDLSVIRLEQLLARLLGNQGAESSGKIADRLTTCIDSGSAFAWLKSWNVIGPYSIDSDDGKTMLNTKFSAEDMAIAGDTNPNITFPNPDGQPFDWRSTINADKTGFVNLGDFYKKESKTVAYVCTSLTSQTDRYAIMRVGCDWRMKIWVNGKQIFQTLQGKNIPAAYNVMVPLKKGENFISFKIASGSRGFGFYADINKEAKPGKAGVDEEEMKKVSLYAGRAIEDEFDPYFFTFW